MLIFWIIFFEIASAVFLLLDAAEVPFGNTQESPWLAFFLMVAGAVVNNLAVFGGQASVMMTSYVPMPANPNFYLGLILFAVGALTRLFHIPRHAGDRQGRKNL